MQRVIRISLGSKILYHVSWNPNNGYVTTTENINEAAVYEDTEFDTRFANSTIEQIKHCYGSFDVRLINKPTINQK